MKTTPPPRIARLLASLLLRGEMREVVIGDLDEAFARHLAAGAPVAAARRRYWRQAIASVMPRRERTEVMIIPGSGARDGWLLDVRQALRVLGRARGFTAVAVLSLGIGIGANAAIFSVIRTLLLDQMAVRAPEELSLLYWAQPGKRDVSAMMSSGSRDPVTGVSRSSNVSYRVYEDIRRAAPAGVQAAGFNFLREIVVQYADQPALQGGALMADGQFFSVLSPDFALGRGLTDADDVEGGTVAVVLSHAFWLRAFGGDPAVLNAPIRVNGQPGVIVGVTAAAFAGFTRGGFFPVADVTVPLRAAPALQPAWNQNGQSVLRSDRLQWVRVLLRRAPNTDLAPAANAFALAIAAGNAPFAQDAAGAATVFFDSAARGLDQTRADTRQLLFVLMGVVGVVLLIACVNLASLMLARGVARQREIAVKRALGAGRARLIRGLLIEGLLLALAGGTLGLLLTFASRASLTSILTAGIGTAPLSRQPIKVSIDPALVAATFGVSVVASLVFSLLPALRLTTRARGAELRHAVLGGTTAKLTLGRLLVALQIGATVPLVVGAILFLRTLANLGGIDLGFNPQNLVLFSVDAAKVAATPAEQSAVYVSLQNHLAAIPGVTSTTMIENVLLSGITSNARIEWNGKPSSISINAVGPGFLETMGMRLVAGRAPGLQDRPGAQPVVALNETAARTLFGDVPPVGQLLKSGGQTLEVVGVVSDSRYERPRDQIKPVMFPSALQRPAFGGHTQVLRTTLPVDAIEPEIRRAVAAVQAGLPVPQVRTQVAQLQESTMRERVFTQMLSLFGAFALLLACIGLHGVTSYSVARRTSEMGIRLALGAQRRQVLWLVQRQVIVLAAIGLVIGVPLALLAAPLVGTLLFGVAPNDYMTIGVAGAVMLLVATAAGLLPARRAANLDPLKALRTE